MSETQGEKWMRCWGCNHIVIPKRVDSVEKRGYFCPNCGTKLN